LAIIVLLIPAYYGVYLYALRLRGEEYPGSHFFAGWEKAAGWCSAALFLTIGFLFTNAMSLMEHVQRWPELWQANGEAGTAAGTALNFGDPTFWPRWLMMFGLALGTTAAWIVFDAAWLARKTTDEAYQAWAWGFAKKLYTLGMIWFAAAGSWYVFGTWPEDLRAQMFQGPLLPLTIATAIAPGLPWLLMMTSGLCAEKRATAAAVFLCQFGVLGVNATSRQIVQNLNLKAYFDVLAQQTEIQWGPLWMFLIVFVIGLGVIGWMLAQLRKCTAPGELK
jgi:hypothetical protein